ncbi:MAG: DUF4328 domain-containing protein [Actinomycetota bacterium]|nr:DUF4328 domain-containing protein [Actinomycetota bacterium]
MRCLRCARTQPPLRGGVVNCIYCGTPLPLPVRRWVAHPPPGADQRRVVRLGREARKVNYGGPPSYGHAHPRWGFPPVRWQWNADPDPYAGVVPPIGGLRISAIAAFVTGVGCAAAAAGELWRFRLMLRGRTEVLPGSSVRASDTLVTVASGSALGLVGITAVLAVPAIAVAHRAAAARQGLTPVRSRRNVLLRLLVPGWNVYGAGQILTETESQLAGRASGSGRPSTSALLRWWWICWLASAVLTVTTLLWRIRRGQQAVADAVELHVAVDAAATVSALLTGLVLLRLARLFGPPKLGPYLGWLVQPPAPTRVRTTDPAARRKSGVLPPDSPVKA